MKSLTLILLFILILGCETETPEVQTTVQEVVQTETNNTVDEISSNSNTYSPDSLFLLQREKAGLFEIGITESKAMMLASEYSDFEIQRIERMIEGMPSPALELTINGTRTLLLEISEGDSVVYRIEIDADILKTINGISVGSSYQDLETYYTFSEIHWGDAGAPLVIIEEENISFVLESGDWWQNGEVTEEIPSETEVTKIIIW